MVTIRYDVFVNDPPPQDGLLPELTLYERLPASISGLVGKPWVKVDIGVAVQTMTGVNSQFFTQSQSGDPTAALDSQSGHAVMALLQELAHQRNRAIVIVSHDSRMLGYADRIVRIEDGRIWRDADEPSAVREAHLELQGASS